eukprot:TRINITY_DN13978_c0_g1_i1.p1 TRINITY_DN13978_c0_g1~~TRINITY_DN13978_c0_g1_i1.p1  ORF type:complete len:140 (+),score=23.69 TRINITY_DN13978_c0_g1_i1:102-521(+)
MSTINNKQSFVPQNEEYSSFGKTYDAFQNSSRPAFVLLYAARSFGEGKAKLSSVEELNLLLSIIYKDGNNPFKTAPGDTRKQFNLKLFMLFPLLFQQLATFNPVLFQKFMQENGQRIKEKTLEYVNVLIATNVASIKLE